MNRQIALEEITNAFFESTIDYSKLFLASRQLKALFYKVSDFNPDSEENRENLPTSNGKNSLRRMRAFCNADDSANNLFYN